MKQEELKVLVVTAKIMQFLAEIFAVFGLILFAFLFFNTYKGDIAAAIHDPFFIVTIVLPFLPAAVLAGQAARKRKQARAALEQVSKSS